MDVKNTWISDGNQCGASDPAKESDSSNKNVKLNHWITKIEMC